jgi:hypothetical protein
MSPRGSRSLQCTVPAVVPLPNPAIPVGSQGKQWEVKSINFYLRIKSIEYQNLTFPHWTWRLLLTSSGPLHLPTVQHPLPFDGPLHFRRQCSPCSPSAPSLRLCSASASVRLPARPSLCPCRCDITTQCVLCLERLCADIETLQSRFYSSQDSIAKFTGQKDAQVGQNYQPSRALQLSFSTHENHSG